MLASYSKTLIFCLLLTTMPLHMFSTKQKDQDDSFPTTICALILSAAAFLYTIHVTRQEAPPIPEGGHEEDGEQNETLLWGTMRRLFKFLLPDYEPQFPG